MPVGPSRNPMGAPQPPLNRTPLLGPNFGAGPTPSRNTPRYIFLNWFPKRSLNGVLFRSPSSGPRYVELSRLPTEMLRPAVLEQFLRPSVPLQISSVKVVYSSSGRCWCSFVSSPAQACLFRNPYAYLGSFREPCRC